MHECFCLNVTFECLVGYLHGLNIPSTCLLLPFLIIIVWLFSATTFFIFNMQVFLCWSRHSYVFQITQSCDMFPFIGFGGKNSFLSLSNVKVLKSVLSDSFLSKVPVSLPLNLTTKDFLPNLWIIILTKHIMQLIILYTYIIMVLSKRCKPRTEHSSFFHISPIIMLVPSLTMLFLVFSPL